MGLPLCFSIQLHVRQGLSNWFLTGALSLACVCALPVQAKVSLQSLALPQAITRSVVLDKSAWHGMCVELEHLLSPDTLEATLEKLALVLPDLTPVWSEQEVVKAHWSTAEASYVLLLWPTEQQGTEGLLSAVGLSHSDGLETNTAPRSSRALDWLPKQATPLFSLVDASGDLPILLSSFAIPMISSQLIDHLKNYGQRNQWLRLHDDLTFVRGAQRLSFLLTAAQGNTTVVVFESSRETP